MAEFATAGEKLLGAALKKTRVAGVPHYVPGQHRAEIIGTCDDKNTGGSFEIARVTYVDLLGHACVVTCSRPTGGDWKPEWVSRAGVATREPTRRAPATFSLSDPMLAALAEAAT